MNNENLSEYQRNYLAYRTAKIAEMNSNIEKQNQVIRQNYANKLYSDFSQGNSRHLKRHVNHRDNAMSSIYSWLRTNAYFIK